MGDRTLRSSGATVPHFTSIYKHFAATQL